MAWKIAVRSTCVLVLIASAGCDLVVANATKGTSYRAFILDKDSRILAQVNSRKKLAAALAKVLQKQL